MITSKLTAKAQTTLPRAVLSALVISDGPVGRDHNLLWVAMITSAENASWPHGLPVEDLAGAGLPAPSVQNP